MATTATLTVKDRDLLSALTDFLKRVLELDSIAAILVPRQLPMNNAVMQTLVADPRQLDGADPLAPAFPMNAAKLVSRLTRKPMGTKTAVVLRPCEIRAFVELVKLNQGSTEEIVIIGIDCLGAYTNTDYATVAGEDARAATRRFYESVLADKPELPAAPQLAPACRVCELPLPEGADIRIGLYGVDTARQLWLEAPTPKGRDLVERLDLPAAAAPAGRQAAVDALVTARTASRDEMFARTRAATDSLEKLTAYLAGCVNCYNCRVACPVCYCRECVFVTDVFDHDPARYLQWARRRGAVKMPTDTTFYHLTRMAHMSTACVGCGQCSNACPNDIPVMELFRSVAARTQDAFDYEAGRHIDEKPPLSEFREEEFKDVVGLG